MNSKFIFGLFSILSLVLLAGFASAMTLDNLSVSSAINVAHDSGSAQFNVTITNTGAAGSVTLSSSSLDGINSITFQDTTFEMADGSTTSVNATITGTAFFTSAQAGSRTSIKATITATPSPLGNPKFTTSATIATIAPFYALSITPNQQEIGLNSQGEITINNIGNSDIRNLTLTYSSDMNVTFESPSVFILAGHSTLAIPISLTGIGTATITATDKGQTSAIASATIDKHFCSAGESAGETHTLIIRSVDFESSGDDADVWTPLDEITITAEIINDGTEKISNIVAQLGLFDSNGKDVTKDITFDNDGENKIKIGSLSDDDHETVEFKFRVPASDLDEGSYSIALKAYDKENEAATCVDSSGDFSNNFYEEISVEKDTDNTIKVDELTMNLNPTSATPGESVTLKFDVYNVGDEDQDKVRINLYNPSLGINTEQIIDNMDVGDGQTIELVFTVPSVKNGNYPIKITTDYDYRSSTGAYRKSSKDEWTTTLQVFGSETSASNAQNLAEVTAELSSDAVAGEPLVVSSTFKNLANATKTFVIGADGFADWATLDSISDRVITLLPGESKDVTFKFNVNEDASGENTFTIQTTSGTNVESDEVSVTIEPKSSLISRLKSFAGGNYMIWGIAAVNVILILLIILVAMRLSRK